MNIETTSYILPAHYVSALLYGDYSGLNDEDVETIDQWLNDTSSEFNLFYCVDVKECGFKHSNDLDNLGADCAEFTFQIS